MINYKIIIKESFEQKLWNDVDWYNERQQGLGEKLLHDVYETMELIAKNPFAFRRSLYETRECVLSVFPYIIVYEIEHETTIVIYKLFPTRNHPRKKFKIHSRKKRR